MDIKLRETTNLGVQKRNSNRQVKRKLAHVVQIRVNLSSLKQKRLIDFDDLSAVEGVCLMVVGRGCGCGCG